MKRIIVVLFLLVAFGFETMAVPALDKPVRRILPDGNEITVRLYGDEFYSYTTTVDGYNIVEHSDGYFYYATQEGSMLHKTAVRAKDPGKRTAADLQALRTISKGIPSSIVSAANRKARSMMSVDAPNMVGEQLDRTGKLKTLIILVSFADNDFTVSDPHTAFTNLLNEDGYDRNGSTGSAWNYYHDNSFGKFDPEFVVVGPYKLPNKMAYYGAPSVKNGTPANDDLPGQMAADACFMADADVDFSEFSENGVIRDVFIFFAGVNQAENAPKDTIWPHRWQVYPGHNASSGAQTTFDGMRLKYYACSSELRGQRASLTDPDSMIANIGTFCHEFGHVLGWCDYYNTKGETNTINLGDLSLMNRGNYLNESRTPPTISSFDRYLVGWLEPEEINAGGMYSLSPLGASNTAFMIHSDVEDEYFFIENRDFNYKWDKYINGGSTQATVDGLIIYHIDRSAQQMNKWHANEPNVCSNGNDHECMKVVRPSLSSTNVIRWFFPGMSNIRNISGKTISEFICWSGASVGYEINDIAIDADKKATFTVVSDRKGSLGGFVTTLDGSPVGGAEVKLYIAENATGSVRRAAAQPVASVITTSDGRYDFSELGNAQYTISVIKENFRDYSTTFVVLPGDNTLNIKLSRTNIEDNLTRIAWHADDLSGGAICGEQNGPVSVAAKFATSDIPVVANEAMLAGVEFFVGERCDLKTTIIKNGLEECSVEAGTVEKGTWKYIDLTDRNVRISSSDILTVAFSVSDYAAGLYPVLYDKGPAVTGKGNLYSRDEGRTWLQFANGNFPIGAFFSFSNAESVTITEGTTTIHKGDVLRIGYVPSPSGSVASVDWCSSDDAIVGIAGDYVYGKAVGQTTVSATYNQIPTGEATIKVIDEITDITVKIDRVTMDATIGWTPNVERKEWKAYCTAPDGKVSTIVSDRAEIILPALRIETTYKVSIGGERTILPEERWGYTDWEFFSGEPLYAERIELNFDSLDIYANSTRALTAATIPAEVYDSQIVWSSDNTAVATVDSEGIVTGIGSGSAVITAKTALGTAMAKCTVNVVDGLADIVVDHGQMDAYLSWQGSAHTGDWRIKYGETAFSNFTSIVQKEQFIYIDKLSDGTGYIFTVTAIADDGTDLMQKSVEFVTDSSDSPYSKIIVAKSSYNAGDKLTLRLGNIDRRIESVEWSIDGNAVTPPVTVLATGMHYLVAVVTTDDGKVQKLIKYITVK